MKASLVAVRRATLRLVADRRGAPLIEFALIVAPLIAMMIAILQVSLAFFTQQNLETITSIATRKLMTGSAQQAGMTQQQFTNYVCAQLPQFMSCSNIMIDVESSANWSAANTSTPTLTYDQNGNINNAWVYAPGGTGAITTVKIMYIWQTTKGPLGFDLSTMSSGKRLMIATSVFKTETY